MKLLCSKMTSFPPSEGVSEITFSSILVLYDLDDVLNIKDSLIVRKCHHVFHVLMTISMFVFKYTEVNGVETFSCSGYFSGSSM